MPQDALVACCGPPARTGLRRRARSWIPPWQGPAQGLTEPGRILAQPSLLPPGDEVTPAGLEDFSLMRSGMSQPIRITINAAYYGQHTDSIELWSPGSPSFLDVDDLDTEKAITVDNFHRVLSGVALTTRGERHLYFKRR